MVDLGVCGSAHFQVLGHLHTGNHCHLTSLEHVLLNQTSRRTILGLNDCTRNMIC